MSSAMKNASRNIPIDKTVVVRPKKETVKKPAQKFSLPPAHYYLTSSLEYNDNIDSVHEKRKGDINISATPGVKMNFVGRSRTVNLDMHINNNYSIYNAYNDAQSGTIELYTNLDLGQYLFSFYNNYFTNYIGTPGLGIDTEDLQYYWSDTLSSMVSRHFNRIGFDLEYIHASYAYGQDYRFSSRNQDTVNFNQYLRIGNKTQLITGYSHVRSMPNHEASYSEAYNYNFYNVGLAGALSSKITGSVKMEYNPHDVKGADDYRETIMEGELGCSASKRTNFNVSLTNLSHETATKSGYYTKNSFSFGMNRRLAFNPKLKLSLTWGVDYTDYPKVEYDPNPKKIVDSSIGLGLAYAFRNWLDLSLNLTHSVHRSNVDTEIAPDYYNNIISFGSQARF